MGWCGLAEAPEESRLGEESLEEEGVRGQGVGDIGLYGETESKTYLQQRSQSSKLDQVSHQGSWITEQVLD